MTILAIGQVEDHEHIAAQIQAQTVKPDFVYLYVDEQPVEGINARRKRITDNHLKLKRDVNKFKPDLVWQLEQDVVMPNDCLERLLADYQKLKSPDFGYISGIQVGRHGIYCIGAWKVGNDTFQSIDPKLGGIQEVDATGFYCLLAERETWLKGIVSWNGEPWGPDVNWGLSLKKRGYKNYVDMDLKLGHDTTRSDMNRGIIYPDHISVCQVEFYKDNGQWKYKI